MYWAQVIWDTSVWSRYTRKSLSMRMPRAGEAVKGRPYSSAPPQTSLSGTWGSGFKVEAVKGSSSAPAHGQRWDVVGFGSV